MSDQIRVSGMILFTMIGIVSLFLGFLAIAKDSKTNYNRWFLASIVCAVIAFSSFGVVAKLTGLDF